MYVLYSTPALYLGDSRVHHGQLVLITKHIVVRFLVSYYSRATMEQIRQERLPEPAPILVLDEVGEAVARAGIDALRGLRVENAEVHPDDDQGDHQFDRRNANNNIWNQDGRVAGNGEAASNIMDPYASARMVITEEERNWALAIKGTIAGIRELDPISDLLCAQLAIVEPTDMEGAIHRVKQLQWFREEYNVRDTLEDAQSLMKEYLYLFENHILAFSYSYQYGCYICCIDVAACDKDLLVLEKQWRTNLGGLFYLHQAMNPDVSSIRNGLIMLYECEGFTFTKMGGINTAKRTTNDLLAFYPTRIRSSKFYHTGKMERHGLLQPFLSKGLTR
jgi:hypothetical protein